MLELHYFKIKTLFFRFSFKFLNQICECLERVNSACTEGFDRMISTNPGNITGNSDFI